MWQRTITTLPINKLKVGPKIETWICRLYVLTAQRLLLGRERLLYTEGQSSAV